MWEFHFDNSPIRKRKIRAFQWYIICYILIRKPLRFLTKERTFLWPTLLGRLTVTRNTSNLSLGFRANFVLLISSLPLSLPTPFAHVWKPAKFALSNGVKFSICYIGRCGHIANWPFLGAKP